MSERYFYTGWGPGEPEVVGAGASAVEAARDFSAKRAAMKERLAEAVNSAVVVEVVVRAANPSIEGARWPVPAGAKVNHWGWSEEYRDWALSVTLANGETVSIPARRD